MRSSIKYAQELKEKLSEIQSSAGQVHATIDKMQREILVCFTRDKRSNMKYDLATSSFSQLLFAGLKSIPFYGGYFALASKVLKDPFKGGYEVSRTQYGSAWGYDNANSVMSPLGPGDKNYNYGAAGGPRVGAFNSDPRLRGEQFEADVHSMVNVSGAYAVSMGRDIGQAKASTQGRLSQEVKAGLGNDERLYIAEWRSISLLSLQSYDAGHWVWYAMSQMITTMSKEHHALNDLQNDVFNIGSDAVPQLAYSVKMGDVGKKLKLSSTNSKLHKTLQTYSPLHAVWDRAIKAVPRINKKTQYRVDSYKATVVAYLTEVREKLAEDVSSHIYKLIDQYASKTPRNAFYLSREGERDVKNIGVFLTLPFRALGAVLPKKVYNYKTTVQSKEWARFLCAIHVFYSVLAAYLDVSLPSDLLPSLENIKLFTYAYGDAYTTAVQYFYHHGVTDSNRNAGEDLQKTLKDIITSDPGISVFIKMIACEGHRRKKVNEDTLGIVMSGVSKEMMPLLEKVGDLQGLRAFKHQSTFGKYDWNKGMTFDEAWAVITKGVDEYNREMGYQDAIGYHSEKGFRKKVAPPPSPPGRGGGSTPGSVKPSPSVTGPELDKYIKTLEAVIVNQGVPEELKEHLIALAEIIEKIKSKEF